MKKIILSLLMFTLISMPAFAATWSAKDRVKDVGSVVVTKNSLPKATAFQIVETALDNSTASSTNTIQIPSNDLQYAGNDNEVAAVIATEIGQITNGKYAKTKIRNAAKTAILGKLSSENILNTAANSEYVSKKTNLNDYKLADMTGVDLMVNAGYNPLALVVLITKMPGSTLEAVMGKPSNSERAMNVYNYISYNYPEKLKAGYNCQEYRFFLTYADPIVESRNKSKSALKKFNKEQEKNKKQQAKSLLQYKATGGVNAWDATYTLLNEFTTTNKKQ